MTTPEPTKGRDTVRLLLKRSCLSPEAKARKSNVATTKHLLPFISSKSYKYFKWKGTAMMLPEIQHIKDQSITNKNLYVPYVGLVIIERNVVKPFKQL